MGILGKAGRQWGSVGLPQPSPAKAALHASGLVGRRVSTGRQASTGSRQARQAHNHTVALRPLDSKP